MAQWPPWHPGRQVRSGALPTVQAAAHGHLVLGHPHGQRQQLHHLMPPGPASPAGGELGKRLPTVLAPLRHDGHDLVHLLDRQQGTPGVRAGRLASGRRAAAGASQGLGGDQRKAAGRSSLSSGPAGLPARVPALAGRHSPHAGRHSPHTGRRSPAGASPTAPAVAPGQEPASWPMAREPTAQSSRSCRGCSASQLAGQARRGGS